MRMLTSKLTECRKAFHKGHLTTFSGQNKTKKLKKDDFWFDVLL
jgi:hypothetical protein